MIEKWLLHLLSNLFIHLFCDSEEANRTGTMELSTIGLEWQFDVWKVLFLNMQNINPEYYTVYVPAIVERQIFSALQSKSVACFHISG